MAGIALILGTGAEQQDAFLAGMRAALAPRGASGQPRGAAGFDGAVFNRAELLAQLPTGDDSAHTDADLALRAVRTWGEDAPRRIRGEYALAVAQPEAGRVFLARDPVGVRPLYWAQTGGRLYVASEIKALVPLGVRVHEVPPGHCGWATPAGQPDLHPYLDLHRLGESGPQLTDVDEASSAIRAAFTDAVRVRVDTDRRVGVVLSGGLDSSLVLLEVRQRHPDCVAFTIGTEGSEDLAYARRLTADLGVEHVVVSVRPQDLGLRAVREAMAVSELTEYGDIINAVVSMRLFAQVRASGVDLVLAGDGSDELFGGYDMYRRIGAGDEHRLFLHKISYLSHTELQRVDRTASSHGVEVRAPFLDPAMLDLAMRIPQELKQRDGYEKWILRHAFADVLPDYIAARHKNPMSHSSGLHERIRLFRPFFPSIYRRTGYDCFAPLQRDFSEVLKDHGYDLDAAAGSPARDLTVAEHARDLVGALRWNLVPMLHRVRPGRSSAERVERRQPEGLGHPPQGGEQ